MKQKSTANQPRRYFLAFALSAAAGVLLLSGCGKGARSIGGGMSFRMGERASIGKLIYNVTEAEWKTSLGDGVGARTPTHRYLLLKVTVTNSGAEQVAIPLLSLYDAAGKDYRELDNGDSVPGWMGFLRMINPAETRHGTLLFDVAPTSYRLQISDGGDTENEKTAWVDVPFKADSDPVVSEPTAVNPEAK